MTTLLSVSAAAKKQNVVGTHVLLVGTERNDQISQIYKK